MAATFERGGEEGGQAIARGFGSDQPGPHRDDIGVVMRAGEPRGQVFGHERAAARRVAIDRDRDADPRSAQRDAALRAAVRDRFGEAVRRYFARWVAALAGALEQSGRDAAASIALAEEIVAQIQGAIEDWQNLSPADRIRRAELILNKSRWDMERGLLAGGQTYCVNPKEPEAAFVLNRGNPGQPGGRVAPGGIVSVAANVRWDLPQDAKDIDRRVKLAQCEGV